jgi:iron complex outermembrane receptor protein
MTSERGMPGGLTMGWAVLLTFFPQAAPVSSQEPPDSVVEIEPVLVRVLRSTVGSGAPYPVSVAFRPELQRGTTGASLEEALRALPGLQIQNRFNLAAGERFVIRGFGARSQFGIRGIRVLVDGIPATLPDGQTTLDHVDPGSLERVEILRGPAAASYGNAAGGVLHLESLPPTTGPAELEARSAVGSDGLRSHYGAVTGSSGSIAYRATASRYAYDGFRIDPVAGDGSTYGRSTRTVVNGALAMPAGSGSLRVHLNALDMASENPGSLSSTLLAEGDRQAYRFNVIQQTVEDVRQGQIGMAWQGSVVGLKTELATWGIRRDFTGRIPPSVIAFDRNAGGVRALTRGTRRTGLGDLAWRAGLEIELQRDDRRNWENDAGEKAALSLDQLERVRGTGAFLQARLDLSPRIAASAGIRFDRFRFEVRDRFLVDATDDSGSRAMQAVSPSAGLVFTTGGRVELFASASTFFETPTTTELANRPDGAGGFNASLDPTRGWTWEGGARAHVGDAWSTEIALFRTSLEEELVPFEVPTDPGRTFFRNSGTSHHRGWEMTVEGRPTPGLWTRVAYTRVDGRFDEYVVDGADFRGNRIPGLAPFRVDGRMALVRAAGFAEVRVLYQDAMPVDDANTAEAAGHAVADIRVGLDGLAAGGLSLSPFASVSNVLDRTYDASVVVNAFGGRYYEPGPGRSFQLGLRASWGTSDR